MKKSYPKPYDEYLRQTLKRIREHRILKNIPQKTIAKQIGISQNAYSKLELGISELTVRKLYIICQMIQEPVNEILLSSTIDENLSLLNNKKDGTDDNYD